VTVDEPALVFGSVLAEVLRKEGISLAGQVRKTRRSAPGEDLLLRHTSTLREDLPVILKRSQNLHAEILLKALGAKVAGEGSAAGGEEAVRRFLRAKKLADEGLVLRDGSGLSHQNRLSAGLLAKVLHSVKSEKYFPEYLRALPSAGEDGTLDERFKGLPQLKGKLFAKTGYISGVSCLSGYVVKGSSVWSFSILVNGLKGGAREAKRLQEEIGERIFQEM
jgi:D-alanyl-D-alanine carboxypeptidase/D-alanyl-D-alanine-endopeptidase (penicillin-binding protein 4)